MLFQPMLASAKCGGVDYSWGADALSNAHDFTVTMMLYVVYLVYAIAAIYGHENEMYKEPMNLKRGKGVYMRELRECGGRTEDKTKCAKG